MTWRKLLLAVLSVAVIMAYMPTTALAAGDGDSGNSTGGSPQVEETVDGGVNDTGAEGQVTIALSSSSITSAVAGNTNRITKKALKQIIAELDD